MKLIEHLFWSLSIQNFLQLSSLDIENPILSETMCHE